MRDVDDEMGIKYYILTAADMVMLVVRRLERVVVIFGN
jgi:hypothetical protein